MGGKLKLILCSFLLARSRKASFVVLYAVI